MKTKKLGRVVKIVSGTVVVAWLVKLTVDVHFLMNATHQIVRHLEQSYFDERFEQIVDDIT